MNFKDRTESLWEGTALPQFEAVQSDLQTETCIIGGGITGISIAYQLAKRGHKVTLVEAFRLGSGQTGRTTAHLTCQLESQFIELLKIHNKDTLSTFLEAHRKAIDVIEEIVESENISCDFKRLDGFLFCGENFDTHKLQEEKKAAHKCGLDLDYVEVTPLLKNAVESLRYPRQGQFHPLKYIAGLVRVLKDLDVKIFEGTHISDIHQGNDDVWSLKTDSGFTISANNLVVATNSPINNRFHIHTKQYAYRTYAMAFKLKSFVKEEVLLWDTEDPYHYIRFAGDTMVIGGEDHKTGQDPENDPFLSLEQWSRENFPMISDVAWKWSGQVLEPMDQIAFIGKNPGVEKNVYISTGESGLGMTSATIASLIIPDLIDKGAHPWAATFDPSRPPVHGLVEFLKENTNVAIQYTDWITPAEVKNIEEIPVDCGGVIREGLSKSCVYHDSDHFERKSAVCPHLGGIVHWNDIEKTWDCPCHGSRFSSKGKVIEGPSLMDLSGT